MSPPLIIHDLPVTSYPVRVGDDALTLLGPADPDALLDHPDTERRFFAEDEHMPYWARPWAAAKMLAEFVCARPRGDGRRALEIGCGLGLVGLVAAMHGWRVTLTDYEETALAFARASAELNGIRHVNFSRLDWRARPGEPRNSNSADATHDLLLASDVLFEARWVDPVASFIASNIGEGVALISDPNRRTSEGFSEAMISRGLRVARHAMKAADFDGAMVHGCVFEIAR